MQQKWLNLVLALLIFGVCRETQSQTSQEFIHIITQAQAVLDVRYQKGAWVESQGLRGVAGAALVSKHIIPAGSTVYVLGDLHGDIQALDLVLGKLQHDGVLTDDLRIVQTGACPPNVYFVFLGDFVDRGPSSIGVITRVCQLLCANPNHGILLHGNHEDPQLMQEYGTLEELQNAFGDSQAADCCAKLQELFARFPVALLLGTEGCDALVGENGYVLFCHAGLERSWDPHALLGSPERFICQTVTDATGFIWNDFSVHGKTRIELGRGISYGQVDSERILASYACPGQYAVRCMIRAHQHNRTMPGLFEGDGLFRLPWRVPIFTTAAMGLKGYRGQGAATMESCFLKLIIGPSCLFDLKQYVCSEGTWREKSW